MLQFDLAPGSAGAMENRLRPRRRAAGVRQEMSDASSFEGGCDCRYIRYRMTSRPLFVHCCHCRWCQRETGASFALNALIEAERVEDLGGEVEIVDTPSESGKGQLFARCPKCRLALWSHYGGLTYVRFMRVGTLDNPDAMPPDIHIFTASKQPWVVLPPGALAVPEYYDFRQHWPAASIERRRIIRGKHGLPV